MRPPKINMLDPRTGVASTRRRFSFWKGALIGLIAVVVTVPVMFSLASVRLLDAASAINPDNEGEGKVSIIEQVRRLVGNSEKKLRGEVRDRINILVLGEGGEGHDGPHLTRVDILPVTPSRRWLEYGVVHRVAWFNYEHGTGRREIFTACGMARDTKNRTRNNLMVTCLACAGRS